MIKINGQRSLTLLMIMPFLLLVQLGIGLSIYRNIKRTSVIEANNNKLDLYLRTNTKYVSYSESAQRGYLLTGDKKYYENYKTDIEEWKKNEAYYDSLSAEIKRREVREIQVLSRKKFDLMALTFQLYNADAKDSALEIVKTGNGQVLMDSVRAKSTFLRNKISAEFTAQRSREYQLLFAFFAVIAALIVFSLLLVWFTYTAFNQYTKSLEKTVASLEEANERMSKYNYNSYHLLRSPLRNITGFLRLLEKKYNQQLDIEAKEYIHHITESVKQLGAIIVDMRRKFLEHKEEDDKRR